MKIGRRLLPLLALYFLPTLGYAKGEILHLTIEGVINPVIGDYVKDGLAEAKESESPLVLIQLNTPGGLLDATRTTISEMINSDIPVIVFVGPQGARATSAGVFITMASDIAVMAPGTHIGAAHPVNVGGGDEKKTPRKWTIGKSSEPADSSVMEEKMVSDAAAYIRGIAVSKNRNAEWAEKAVRESVSLTAEEAVKERVIDLIAASQDDLLAKIDGRSLTKNSKTIKINAKAPVKIYSMSQLQKLLHKVAHPNIAYILLTIGLYGLIYELATPGIGLGGSVGVVCLLLAFFSLQVLPINTVGLALIILGIILLVLELVSPTHGLLTLSGLASFALGSFFLIDIKNAPAYARISLELIISTVGVTALFFIFIIRKAFAIRRAKPKVGAESLVGTVGVAEEALSPEGLVSLEGELWTAISNQKIEKGEKVIVTKIEGNKLTVKKA